MSFISKITPFVPNTTGYPFIVRSLFDTDFYKIVMLQYIWKFYRDLPITFSLHNRTKRVKIAKTVSRKRVEAELKHVTTLTFTEEMVQFLREKKPGMFEEAFLEWLLAFRMTECWTLEEVDGQWALDFKGPWAEVTLWEIHALEIMNELRVQTAMEKLPGEQKAVVYEAATKRIVADLEKLAKNRVKWIEFGTRRRHSGDWQEYVVGLAVQICGEYFKGTSNVYLAMKLGLPFGGTNAHELPMTVSTLAVTDEELQYSQYGVLEKWEELYGQPLRIILPDTYGTTQFLRNAPAWLLKWAGVRLDSKDPRIGGEEVIAWWEAGGENPKDKTLMPSDGLNADLMCELERQYGDRTNVVNGWGTLCTNNFEGLGELVGIGDELDPISIVCKVSEANGKGTVKLSDNPEKAMGPQADVVRALRVFGIEGLAKQKVKV